MAKTPPLHIENLEDTSNLLFCTLLEFKRVKYLVIIENVVNDEIQAYALDSLASEGIDQDWFLSVATRWYYSASDRYPLSFEFAKIGQADVIKKVLKTFNVNSVSRVIGKLFVYDVNSKPKIKRRKVVQALEVNEIKLRKSIK